MYEVPSDDPGWDEEAFHWEVFVEWSGRKAVSPLSRRALKARQARFRERAAEFSDVPADGCLDLGGDLGGIFLAILLIAVIILLAPILIVVLFAIIEVTIVLAIAGAAFFLRTMLNRPWRVVAVHGSGELWSWKQVGWQRARELVERIQRELDAGASPGAIAPGDATPEGRDELALNSPTHLVESDGVRFVAKLAAFAVIIAAVAAVLVQIG